MRGSKALPIWAAMMLALCSGVVFNALGTESTVTTSFDMDRRLGTPVPAEMRFKRSGP